MPTRQDISLLSHLKDSLCSYIWIFDRHGRGLFEPYDGLLDLCDCLVSAHNRSLRELDLSETQIADRGIEALIETMRCIERIVVVEIEGCREVSQEMRDKLDAALRRNKM